MAEGIQERGPSAEIILLEGATLTADFDDNTSEVYAVSPLSQLELGIDYTMDATETGNRALLKILFSSDGVTFFPYASISNEPESGGVVIAALYERQFAVEGTAGTAVLRWLQVPSQAKFFKVAASEEGLASAGGLLTVKAIMGDFKYDT